jgi:hypothetical protein
VVVVAIGCGGRSTLLPYENGHAGPVDASADGDDGALPGDAAFHRCSPTLVPVCSGQLSQCLEPDAGVVQHGASVIQCQPEECLGPWTLVLERLIGTTWQMVQTQVVEEPGFGANFYDTSGPPTLLTYRVCALANSTTAVCGAQFTTQGPPDCRCEPTTCLLETACHTEIDNHCNSVDVCGACTNGMPCNGYNTCCPDDFWSDGWGGCVCAPRTITINGVSKTCPTWRWNTATCTCDYGM